MKDDSYLIISIHRLVKELDRNTAAICAAHGLTTPQFMVLEALLNKGSLTVGQIKDAVLGSNGTIPLVVNNLAKQGLVQRATDPADRRKTLVSLTAEGRALIEQVAPENERMFAGKFSVWTQEEKRELVRLLSAYRTRSRAVRAE